MDNKNNTSNGSGVTNNRNLWISIAAIIVVLAIIVFGSRAKAPAEVPADTASDTTTQQSALQKLGGANATASATVSNEFSYDAALKAYDGKTVSIGEDCSATPKALSLTGKNRVLFTNASNAPVTLGIAGNTVTLAPFHYKTYTLSTPGVYPVSCGAVEDAATVTIQ